MEYLQEIEEEMCNFNQFCENFGSQIRILDHMKYFYLINDRVQF